MTKQFIVIAMLLLGSGCPRASVEPAAVPEEETAAAAAVQPEPPVVDDRIVRLELGWGIASLTERGVLEFRGAPEIQAWLAEQAPIEDIWQGSTICVRTAEGTSCKLAKSELRIEPPTDAKVIDVEWSSKTLCVATADGAVWCSIGSAPHTKPLRRYPVSGARDIEIEGEFGCALLEDGSAQCWLGEERTFADLCRDARDTPGCQDLTADQASWPAPGRIFPAIRDIAVGYKYVCILGDDGAPRCYDDATYDVGSLGHEFTVIAGVPALVEIHGGLRHVCGLSQAGEVWCWGSNEYGQLGDGTTQSLEPRSPTRVDGVAQVERLAVASGHACAVAQGELWCWGWLTDTPTDSIPTEIPGVVASEIEVEALRSCARVDTGWKCWGGESHTPGGIAAVSMVVDATRDEQFGDGCRFGSGRLRCDDGEDVWLDLRGVIDVARTSDPVCALLHQRVECHESFVDEKIVIRVPASVSLHGTIDYGCVLTKLGAVHCWRDGASAVPIDLPGKQVAVSVSIDLAEACALDESGNVRCWTADQPPLLAGVSDIVELHGGPRYGCVRDRAGKIACWGRYMIADNYAPAPEFTAPVAIELRAPAVELGVGEDHACARLDDGHVFCWGSEMNGQRGRLSSEYALAPTKLPASTRPTPPP